MRIRVRGYNCVRRDIECNSSVTGGICLFTSHLYLSNVVTLHTSLQAVAVLIHIHSLVTVCFIYLPPNDVIPQVNLNHSGTLTDIALCEDMMMQTLVGDR
ncbi:hypothetical protein TNCV_4802841 [Trichonephila clavipes]|nr:hypothetical protein TNCV_4802841 [Trichonephila clavipes]